MYIHILSSDDLGAKHNKNRLYNQNQTEVGSPLRTLKGSIIKRSKYGVGKLIGGSLYHHKDYLHQIGIVYDDEEYYRVLDDLEFELVPSFDWNCVKYDLQRGELSCVECPDFDTSREHIVGRICTIHRDGTVTETKFHNQIYHHKWLFVQNDYTGFNVAESWCWSKQWLSVLAEPANGSSQQNWIQQLKRFGLK